MCRSTGSAKCSRPPLSRPYSLPEKVSSFEKRKEILQSIVNYVNYNFHVTNPLVPKQMNIFEIEIRL